MGPPTSPVEGFFSPSNSGGAPLRSAGLSGCAAGVAVDDLTPAAGSASAGAWFASCCSRSNSACCSAGRRRGEGFSKLDANRPAVDWRIVGLAPKRVGRALIKRRLGRTSRPAPTRLTPRSRLPATPPHPRPLHPRLPHPRPPHRRHLPSRTTPATPHLPSSVPRACGPASLRPRCRSPSPWLRRHTPPSTPTPGAP